MNIWETLKKPFLSDPEEKKLSSTVDDKNTLDNLEGDIYTMPAAFFDNQNANAILGITDLTTDLLERQKNKIMQYRRLAKNADVDDAIEEIINEVVNVLNDKNPLILDFSEENDKIQEAITKCWDKINRLVNTKKNLYSIVRNGYVDGQFKFHLGYLENNTKEGIQTIKMIEPSYFYFDSSTKKYKYHTKDTSFFSNAQINPSKEYSREEIIEADFDMVEDGIHIGYLEKAIKTANQLSTLEDLLIPLRFSRSISRRVFNVDVGELAPKKAEEAMRQYQNKFKYKKFYNAETGEVSNQQHITSMVEDYWFSNRSGGKGTTVDVLDESGNLGELDDILYFYKKLYKNMKVPSNRIPNTENAEFDYSATSVTKEDIKFFMFISRIRNVISNIFKEILQREVISTGIMSNKEWDEYKDKISVRFINQNKFIEKMELDTFITKLDNFATAMQHKEFFGVGNLITTIFGITEEGFIENLKAVAKEKKSNDFKHFYEEPEM